MTATRKTMRQKLTVKAEDYPDEKPVSKRKGPPAGVRFKKGFDPRRAGGRPKGSKNRISKGMLDSMSKDRARAAPVTPLDYMIDRLLHGTKKEKMWAAEKAAPYIHRKMPTAIEGGDKPIGFFDASQLSKLSTPDLRKMLELMKQIGVMSENGGGDDDASAEED